MDNPSIFSLSDLQNSFRSHEKLCELAKFLRESSDKSIIIDCKKAGFIASNLFAVLGCIINENKKEGKVGFSNINPGVKDSIQKSGFNKQFDGIAGKNDIYKTSISYKMFRVEEIDEYERYLNLQLFSRPDLPQMSRGVSDYIIDYLLELFKNVCDHTECERIYTCGQFFPQSKLLYFTVADGGKTIIENVEEYHNKIKKEIPDNCLEWAIASGNSTSLSKTPRGIGLHLIKEFVSMNNGQLFIFSGSDTYEITNGKERYCKFNSPFPGTVVTLAFNLSDKGTYCLSSENISEIVF